MHNFPNQGPRLDREWRMHNVAEDVRADFLEKEARQARQASGYKVRRRIAWSQVVGLLMLAAFIVGVFLLLLHG